MDGPYVVVVCIIVEINAIFCVLVCIVVLKGVVMASDKLYAVAVSEVDVFRYSVLWSAGPKVYAAVSVIVCLVLSDDVVFAVER